MSNSHYFAKYSSSVIQRLFQADTKTKLYPHQQGALLTLFVPGANLFTEAFGGVFGASDCTANPFEAGDVVARCFVIFAGVVVGLTARPDAFAFEVEFFGGGFFVIVRC